MDLKEFAAALLRRWYFTVAVLLVAVVAGYGIAQMVGARFTAVATTVLVPPKSTLDAATVASNYAPPNPLMYMSGLGQARDVLVRAMGADPVVEEFASRVPSGTYQVAPDPVSSGPVVVVTVEASSPDEALAGLDVLLQRLPTTLTSIQQQVGVGPENVITTLRLTTDTTPEVNSKAQVQAAIMGTALVLLVGLFALGYFDGAMLGRRSRNSRRLASASELSRAPSGAEVLTRRRLRAQRAEARQPVNGDREHVNSELPRAADIRTEPVGSARR